MTTLIKIDDATWDMLTKELIVSAIKIGKSFIIDLKNSFFHKKGDSPTTNHHARNLVIKGIVNIGTHLTKKLIQEVVEIKIEKKNQ